MFVIHTHIAKRHTCTLHSYRLHFKAINSVYSSLTTWNKLNVLRLRNKFKYYIDIMIKGEDFAWLKNSVILVLRHDTMRDISTMPDFNWLINKQLVWCALLINFFFHKNHSLDKTSLGNMSHIYFSTQCQSIVMMILRHTSTFIWDC